ncbi:sphingosine hydroxylase [Physcia stellaris]|nr:sphingosine hydroxylase [Physcia stellaris]
MTPNTTIPTNDFHSMSPSCTERPMQPLLFNVPDKYTIVILPVVAYWSLSLLFFALDEGGYLSKYKLHTPAEFLKRNRVSMRHVVQDVLIQHLFQTLLGSLLAWYEPDSVTGCESRDVLAWALWVRKSVQQLPFALPLQISDAPSAFEQLAARALYWLLIPATQYLLAIFFVDTWQYFIHRAMHTSPYLYRTFHVRHHRLYVPYAFGALYNHPLEGFLEDTVGSLLAFKFARLSVRQGIWFFVGSTLKTVDDHSGFRVPWDPLQCLTDNNAYYHDIHHQSWGMKPFTSFWDRLFGTMWTAPEAVTNEKYEKGRKGAVVVYKEE